MTVYTIRQYLGDRTYFAGTSSYGDILDLDCQNTNGYNYVTGATPGSWDCAYGRNGNITVSGTFTLTNARTNLGTTSLRLPSTGYIRTTSSSSINVQYGYIAFWIYLDALPASDSDNFVGYSTSSTSLPSSMAAGNALSIRSDGKLSLLARASTLDVYTAISTTALTAGVWNYVSVAWSDYNVYFGINGTVTLVKPPGTFRTGSFSGVYGLVVGNSVLNTAGMYLDDIRLSQHFVPGLYTSNYSVPTQEFATYMQTTQTAFFRNTFGQAAFQPPLRHLNAFKGLDGDTAGWTRVAPANNFPSYLSMSTGLREMFGVQMKPNGSTIVPNSERTGGGSIRPASGMVYPRKT